MLHACGTHLLLLSLLGKVTLLQAYSPQKVSEVAKQCDDAEAHICHDGHVHGRLLIGLLARLPGARPIPSAVSLYKNRGHIYYERYGWNLGQSQRTFLYLRPQDHMMN